MRKELWLGISCEKNSQFSHFLPCPGLLLSSQAVLSTIYYKETFEPDWETRWTHSTAKSDYGKFKLTSGKFYGDKAKDAGIQTSQDAKFYAISSPIASSFSNEVCWKSIVGLY